MISDTIRQFARDYSESLKLPFKYDATSSLLVKELPDLLYKSLNLSKEEYLVKGSVGNGKWAEIPWFAIMHKGVTSSTQNGYYIVGLFSKDLKTLYIALGLGWTQFEERYGAKIGKEKVADYSKQLSYLLPYSKRYNKGLLELGAKSARAKGYEASNAVWYSLNIESLGDEFLVEELKYLLECYEYLMKAFGADLFFNTELTEQDEQLEESLVKQIRLNSVSTDKSKALVHLQALANTLPPQKQKRYVSEIIRNAAFATYVKERANFVCEVCGKKPFVKSSGKFYAEADHVQPLFLNGKDHPDNMRCLCAQCHRVLTYGSNEEVAKLSMK